MKWRLVYEDLHGYCRVVVPNDKYRQPKETEEDALARLYLQSIAGVIEFIACDASKIPTDLAFRDAWKKGDLLEPIKIDFTKAVEIHRERIKEAAAKKIHQLEEDLIEAKKGSNLPLQVAIKRTCEILVNLHEVMNMTHCKSIADVKFCIPKELHDVWHFYEPIRSTG